MMSGKSMVINMTTISSNRNGIFCFTIFSSDCFDMPWATNKFMPSSGVRKPMHRLIVESDLARAELSHVGHPCPVANERAHRCPSAHDLLKHVALGDRTVIQVDHFGNALKQETVDLLRRHCVKQETQGPGHPVFLRRTNIHRNCFS
jgi:hypothetical protein